MTAQRQIDIDELRRHAEAGNSVRSMAKSLGFHHSTVSDAARRDGIAIQPHDFQASITEFWRLNTEPALKLRDEGLSATRIGLELGCSKNAVIGRFNRLGLCRPLDQIRRDPTFWIENDALALELHTHGWSIAKIGRRIGRSRKSVRARLLKLRQRELDQIKPHLGRRLARVEFPEAGFCMFPNACAPSDPLFSFCGAQVQIGSSYCPHHHQTACLPARKPAAISGRRLGIRQHPLRNVRSADNDL